MKKILSSILLVFSLSILFAQENPIKGHDFAEEIHASDLESYLTILASDEFEGRETGQEGQRKAAQYIADQFKSFGIPPRGENGTYFQEISFYNQKWNAVGLTVNGNRYKHLYDFYAFPGANKNRPSVETKKVYFLGYGIDDPNYSDYRGKKFRGKTVLIYSGEPKNKAGNFLISKNDQPSDWSASIDKKLAAAAKAGVETLLIIDPNAQKNISENRLELVGGRTIMGKPKTSNNSVNHLFISPAVAKDIIGTKMPKVVAAREKIEAGRKSKRVKLKSKLSIRQQKDDAGLIGSNVVGLVEGVDPDLKDEMIIVTAHYDHLGKKGKSIFNGADDNGSGTSTILGVAKAAAAAKAKGMGSKRSILFMLVSGEEKGLLGSKYYVNHPLFPLENAVANINVDMVGRIDQKYHGNPNYLYVIGADRLSTELHEINERMNSEHTNLTLDYKYNDEKDPNRYYYRSDHYNFAEKGIPAVFFFNGTHADYHRPSDTVEKINFEKMEKIGKLVYHTAWELANRPERIKVDVRQ